MKNVRRVSRLAIAVWLWTTTSYGAAALVPEYRITVKNAAQVQELVKKNAWMQELYNNNLYQGLMIRLGPVFFTTGDNNDNAWEGRLIDFLVARLLQNRLMSFSYYHLPGLVSPMGISVHQLGMGERTLVSGLLNKLQTHTPQEVQIGDKKVMVTPIAVKLQKFAAVLTGDCLTLSRDPRLAASLSTECSKAPANPPDATLTVSLQEFFPPWYPLLNNLIGVESQANLTLSWDGSAARFVPAQGQIKLKPGHLLTSGKAPATLLGAIPADTQFFITAFLPEPESLDKETITKYLESPRAELVKRPSVPVTFLHMGMALREEDGKALPLSAVVLPIKKTDEKTLQNLYGLFDEKGSFELKYRVVCQNFVALSQTVEALDRIEKTCQKKTPSFQQMPDKMQGQMTGTDFSVATFVNLGKLGAQSTDFGWKSSHFTRKRSADDNTPSPDKKPETETESATPPSELIAAQALLTKLPAYLFAGKASNQELILTGAK